MLCLFCSLHCALCVPNIAMYDYDLWKKEDNQEQQTIFFCFSLCLLINCNKFDGFKFHSDPTRVRMWYYHHNPLHHNVPFLFFEILIFVCYCVLSRKLFSFFFNIFFFSYFTIFTIHKTKPLFLCFTEEEDEKKEALCLYVLFSPSILLCVCVFFLECICALCVANARKLLF